MIDPLVKHFGGYHVESGSFIKIENMKDSIAIGDSILKMAVCTFYIESEPIL